MAAPFLAPRAEPELTLALCSESIAPASQFDAGGSENVVRREALLTFVRALARQAAREPWARPDGAPKTTKLSR